MVSRILEIESFVAAINANPLSQSDVFGICDMGTYGADNLREMRQLVAYSMKPSSYRYYVFLELERTGDVKMVYIATPRKMLLRLQLQHFLLNLFPQQIKATRAKSVGLR